MQPFEFEGQTMMVRETAHRQDDDLLSGGLGWPGLGAPMPLPDSLESITPALLRRRALHANWNGITFLGGEDRVWRDALAHPVPGREFQALLRLPGALQSHRVLLQVPDSFDPRHPRLLVTASSGSRGIYGAVAVAGAWGLPKGWAVAYTDKACGTDWYDVDSAQSPGLDGMLTGDPALQAFRPDSEGAPAGSVLIKHAHSADNPESRWGECVRQAARFAWTLLDRLFERPGPGPGPRRHCLAVGLSNGGAAVLRGLELAGLFDGAVVLAPNVLARRGGRAFFDYATEASLWMPLAQLDPLLVDAPAAAAPVPMNWHAEQASEALRLRGENVVIPRTALRFLRRRGWPLHTLRAARQSCLFDFWLAGGVTYSASLGRFAVDQHPLGSWFAPVDANWAPRAGNPLERALWWSDSAGIVPGAGVGILHPRPRAEQIARLAGLASPGSPAAARLRAGIQETRCAAPAPGIPVLVIHGRHDGLIPACFSSAPYVRQALAAGREIAYWQPPDSPHFDAYLGMPGYGEHYRPLLPFGLAGLDAMWERVARGTALPAADCPHA